MAFTVTAIVSEIEIANENPSNGELSSNADDRKNTADGCFYVGTDLVVWMSKMQNSVSQNPYNGELSSNADDRKSIVGVCFYVGTNLVAWMSKKQNYVSLSTVEAEYIVVGSCCSQLLWMKKLLGDYGISQETMVVYCDNFSAIDISKNPVQHSKTKHIEIRYHFIRDLVDRKVVALEYILTERQNADIFSKPLDRSKFKSLHQVIGVITCLQSHMSFMVLVLIISISCDQNSFSLGFAFALHSCISFQVCF